ncbi:MAG: type II secretion system protein [bacterium]
MRRRKTFPAVRERGFTLVELLVSMGIMSILATIAAATFRVTMETREKAVLKMELAENARTTLDFLAEEIRTSYLTPESVAPVIEGQESAPRLRFAGVHRDRPVVSKANGVAQWTPGAGEDEDGDGKIDEEWLDGLDSDWRSSAQNVPWFYNPDLADGEIDEDIGEFPSDLLHFVTAQQDTAGGQIVLTEVSYGLNSIGTRLIRRAHKIQNEEDVLYVGQFLVNPSQPGGTRFIPAPLSTRDKNGAVKVNRGYPAGIVRLINQAWDSGADDVLNGSSNDRQISEFEILAYDIRGLRFRYWYYDYNQGGWRVTREWDSARETLLFNGDYAWIFDGNIPAFSADVPTNDPTRYTTRTIANERTDIFPRDPLGEILGDLRSGIGNLLSDSKYASLVDQVNTTTDGLPSMVDIEIYVQDRDRSRSPLRFSTRVFLPNNNIPPPRSTGGVTS